METLKPESEYNMLDWWKKVMIKNYANFDGRARRAEYWWTILMNIIIGLCLYIFGIVLMFAIGSNGDSPLILIGLAPYVLFVFGTFIPSLALAVRRLHDRGKSGWYYLICLIPIIGSIILLIEFASEGDSGQNEYGPDPKALGNDNEINEIGQI